VSLPLSKRRLFISGADEGIDAIQESWDRLAHVPVLFPFRYDGLIGSSDVSIGATIFSTCTAQALNSGIRETAEALPYFAKYIFEIYLS
jgi:hypothetical protein